MNLGWGGLGGLLADHQALALAGYEWAIWLIACLGIVAAIVAASVAAHRSAAVGGRSTELPWAVCGRRIRPVSLAVLLSTATITYALVSSGGVGSAGTVTFPWPALALAAIAVGGVAHLLIGWVVRSETAMQIGLALASAIWAARAVYLALDNGWWSQTSLLSWAWALVAGGAHLLSVVEFRAERGRE